MENNKQYGGSDEDEKEQERDLAMKRRLEEEDQVPEQSLVKRLEELKGSRECEDIETSKPDIACKLIYPALARAALFDLHDNTLEMVEKGLDSTKGPRNLIVVGPGTEFLPFSNNLDNVVRMLNGGNLMLMDYNEEICGKLEDHLNEKGFDKYFTIENVQGDYNLNDAKSTIFVETRDLKQGYGFPDNSIDGIDMTVTIHHATQYESDLEQFCKDAYRALKPGGIFHIGEGDVDMKHSEKKLKKLAKDIIKSGEKAVRVTDARYHDSEPRVLHFGDVKYTATMIVSDTGMIKVSYGDAPRICKHLQDKGYKQIYRNNGDIILPLIDHAMEEDFQRQIVPVRNYYSEIIETCLPRLAKEYHADFLKAISKERSDAECGVVEYYSPPTMVLDNLRKTGFKIQETRYTKHGPFVNILARKPLE